MPLGCIRVDAGAFPLVRTRCLRCGASTEMRFAGPCAACSRELHEKFAGTARVVASAEYEPKMHVTPNAVALKDD
jgi:hypothetical protein